MQLHHRCAIGSGSIWQKTKMLLLIVFLLASILACNNYFRLRELSALEELLEQGVINPLLRSLADSTMPNRVRVRVLWSIANIAKDSVELGDELLQRGVLALLSDWTSSMDAALPIGHLLSNLCKRPGVDLAAVFGILSNL